MSKGRAEGEALVPLIAAADRCHFADISSIRCAL